MTPAPHALGPAQRPRGPSTSRRPTLRTLRRAFASTCDRWRARRYNLFSDPEIITLPSSLGWLNGPIATIISKTRAPTSREGYAAIGGGSPQLATTIKQGEALEAAMLNLHGVEAGQPVN